MSHEQKRALVLFLFLFIVYHLFSSSEQKADESITDTWERSGDDGDETALDKRLLRQLQPAVLPGERLPNFILPKVTEGESSVVSSSLSWSVGNVRTNANASASARKDGYQADFAEFHGVRGRVVSPLFSPHFSELLEMRPLLWCDEEVMTFTASGQGLTHLLVDRGPVPPISPSLLPTYCGYNVRMSTSDLEVTVSYDACYIILENDSYVLPLLWWDNPVRLSCPVRLPVSALSPSHFLPSVFCSQYGMAVQVHGQEQDVAKLGVTVNGDWGPFVSEDCAYLAHLRENEFTFFIPFKDSCIINSEVQYLQLVLDEQGYFLSCPPGPHSPDLAGSASPAPATYPPTPTRPPRPAQPPQPPQPPPSPYSPHAPTREQVLQLPYNPYDPYHGLPQAYPPGPQHVRPTGPPPGHAPGSQQLQHESLYKPAYVPGKQQNPSSLPAPKSIFTLEPALGPGQDGDSQKISQFLTFYQPHPPDFPYVTEPDPELQLPPPYLYHPFYYNFYHLYYNPPYPPGPQYHEATPVTTVQPVTTLPTTAATLSTAPMCATESTETAPKTQMPHHQCQKEGVVVFLPHAHLDSIQVKDEMKTWQFLSNVSSLCGYLLMPQTSGVFLFAPLPTCHSHHQTPTTISLPLRFWDLSKAQFHTLELVCAYNGGPEPPEPPAPVLIPKSVTPPSPTDSPDPRPQIICSSHQMSVKIPSGPISGILLKDLNGNQIKPLDALNPCGYTVGQGTDGQTHLNLELQSDCHMVVQGKMHIISIVYVTKNGSRETQLSCPVVRSSPSKVCNIPGKQRLPCGPAFVSRAQCLSMGCCSSKHAPACFYPMDECTIDHHFVFTVPASITEPPLSPALLVAASNSTCKPQRVTPDYALFKIPMDGCGAHRVVVGKTVIYMVEVVSNVQGISFNYGTITRDSPVRLLVECRYQPDSVVPVSYLVKTPSFGAGVQPKEMFGVQLRIAKDAQYSSYYPQYHQPLQMLLGKPLYLEVRILNPPDPSLVLLVHFCVAYPRSGKSIWILLYNGCPNPLDPAPHQVVLSPVPGRQTRRFTISTFQFLHDGELKDTSEEIYFMCSTEVCAPSDGPCVEGCFGQ